MASLRPTNRSLTTCVVPGSMALCAQRASGCCFYELVAQTIAESCVLFAQLISATLFLKPMSSTTPPHPERSFQPPVDLSYFYIQISYISTFFGSYYI